MQAEELVEKVLHGTKYCDTKAEFVSGFSTVCRTEEQKQVLGELYERSKADLPPWELVPDDGKPELRDIPDLAPEHVLLPLPPRRSLFFGTPHSENS
ncbi:hypothetical protein QOT17_016067 [Balamuthia mandrillaris]